MRYLFLSLILVDQITKILVRKFMPEKIEIIPNFFNLNFSQNHGIAFSIPFPRFFLILFSIVILSGIGYFLFSKKLGKTEKFGLILIASGATGNLFDRVFFGSVSDFLSFFPPQNLPIFNFADIFITFGVGIFLLKGNYKNQKKTKT